MADPALAAFDLRSEAELAQALAETELVVYSDALAPDHPWRVAVEQAGVMALSLYQAEGQFVTPYRVIAIAGTHGKSSTTGLLAHILVAAGLDPTVRVGASMPGWDNRNARLGQSEWLVIEADEYQNHFHQFYPEIAVITSIDFDHPDWFDSLEAVEQSFSTFLHHVSDTGLVVVPEPVQQAHARITWPATTRALQTNPQLAVIGQHMKSPATLATALAEQLGVSQADAQAAVATWPGIGRRFEQLGDIAGVPVISDYGHHPTELTATLAAAQERFAGGKLLVLFEPHTMSRATQFAEAFAEALAPAAGVIRVPIFRARGETVSQQAEAALTAVLQQHAQLLATPATSEDIVNLVKQHTPNYDAVIAFTAGSLDAILRDFLTEKSA